MNNSTTNKFVLSIESSLKSDLKKNLFIKGFGLIGLGIGLWVLGGFFLPTSVLMFWGWPILLIGGAAIAWGVILYRQIKNLEEKPNKIEVTELEELYFSLQDIPTFKIDLNDIEEMAFLDDDHRYGIGFWIKNPKSKHITVLHPTLDLDGYLKETEKQYFCDIFMPYFSKRSFTELEELYKKI